MSEPNLNLAEPLTPEAQLECKNTDNGPIGSNDTGPIGGNDNGILGSDDKDNDDE
jgi:hypothetical protein